MLLPVQKFAHTRQNEICTNAISDPCRNQNDAPASQIRRLKKGVEPREARSVTHHTHAYKNHQYCGSHIQCLLATH